MEHKTSITFDGKTFHYPKIWALSDAHFRHDNIRTLCNRPFKSVEEMDETLIQNMRNVMGRDDLLIFGGDFCNWKKDHKGLFNKFMGLIPCNNVFFVFGNHDHKIREYIASNSKVIWSGDLLHATVGNTVRVFSHYPLFTWWRENRGAIHYHGHIHNSHIEPKQNRVNISVEVIEYKPIEIK